MKQMSKYTTITIYSTKLFVTKAFSTTLHFWKIKSFKSHKQFQEIQIHLWSTSLMIWERYLRWTNTKQVISNILAEMLAAPDCRLQVWPPKFWERYRSTCISVTLGRGMDAAGHIWLLCEAFPRMQKLEKSGMWHKPKNGSRPGIQGSVQTGHVLFQTQ